MSRRFGRNQKRAMLEQIAFANKSTTNLSEALLLEKGLRTHLREKLDEANDILGDVSRILGRNFAGLKPDTHEIDAQQRCYSYRLPGPVSPDFKYNETDVLDLVPLQLHHLEHVYPKVVRDRIQGDVHIHLLTPDGRQSYAVSGSAWLQMKKDRRRMFKEFAPMIADELARFIAGGEK